MQVEGRAGALDDQFCDRSARGGRMHQTVTTEAGADVEAGEIRGFANDRVPIRSFGIQTSPAVMRIDRDRCERWSPRAAE